MSVNDPKNDPDGVDFNIKISIKKSDPIRKFKEQIGSRFGLEMNEFYLKRNTNDKEIKEMSSTLAAAGFTSHSNIKVVMGTPSFDGGYKVKLSKVYLTDDCLDKGN